MTRSTTSTDEAPDRAADGDAAPDGGTPRTLARVLVVAALVLLAVAGQRAWAWQQDRSELAGREAAAKAASVEVERLISVSGGDADDAFDELLDGATASFRSDLEAQATSLRKALRKNKVDADGEVVSAGVARSTSDRATVFVAATGTVANKRSAQPQSRDYRVKVEMRRVDGRWLVAGLEFVA